MQIIQKFINRFVPYPFTLWLVVMGFLAGEARPSAFSIHELGVRAAGMGGAFVAIADDGSALYFNPAGIAFQKGWRVEVDGFVLRGLFHFIPSATPPGTVVPEDGYDGSIKPKFQPLANLYVTKDLSPQWTLGFGVFMPYGLGGNWTNFESSDPPQEKFVARFVGTRPIMQSIWFQPTLAYQLTENQSVAVGVAVIHSHIFLESSFLNPLDDALEFGEALAPQIFPGQDPVVAGRSIARMLPEGRSRLAASGQNPGFSLGYLYKHQASKTNFGMMFRSSVVQDMDGHTSFAFTEDYPLKQFIGADTLPSFFPTQDIKMSMTTPSNFQVGVANSAFWDSLIAVDFQVQTYDQFKSVAVQFSQTEGTATPEELRLEFDFGTSYLVRAGLEKRLNEKTILRGGYYFDHSPVPDKDVSPLFPDSTRHSLTAGVSRLIGNMEVSAFYQATDFLNRHTDVPENAVLFTNGEWRSFAHLFGFGIRMNFSGPTVDVNR